MAYLLEFTFIFQEVATSAGRVLWYPSLLRVCCPPCFPQVLCVQLRNDRSICQRRPEASLEGYLGLYSSHLLKLSEVNLYYYFFILDVV